MKQELDFDGVPMKSTRELIQEAYSDYDVAVAGLYEIADALRTFDGLTPSQIRRFVDGARQGLQVLVSVADFLEGMGQRG